MIADTPVALANLICVRLLFRKADLSEIKQYCIEEWTKMLHGKVSIQDLIIAKEVKLGSYRYVRLRLNRHYPS